MFYNIGDFKIGSKHTGAYVLDTSDNSIEFVLQRMYKKLKSRGVEILDGSHLNKSGSVHKFRMLLRDDYKNQIFCRADFKDVKDRYHTAYFALEAGEVCNLCFIARSGVADTVHYGFRFAYDEEFTLISSQHLLYSMRIEVPPLLFEMLLSSECSSFLSQLFTHKSKFTYFPEMVSWLNVIDTFK